VRAGGETALPRPEIIKLDWGGFQKKNPGPPCPGLATFPRVPSRDCSMLTKVVQRSRTAATKWHRTKMGWVLLRRHSGSRRIGVMGFPPHHSDGRSTITGSPVTEPEAPVQPPCPGLLFCQFFDLNVSTALVPFRTVTVGLVFGNRVLSVTEPRPCIRDRKRSWVASRPLRPFLSYLDAIRSLQPM
jgi:hypothetical protein